MQLNQAKFMQNGGCGYVLRPEYMFQSNYSPMEPSTVSSDLTMIESRLKEGNYYITKDIFRADLLRMVCSSLSPLLMAGSVLIVRFIMAKIPPIITVHVLLNVL